MDFLHGFYMTYYSIVSIIKVVKIGLHYEMLGRCKQKNMRIVCVLSFDLDIFLEIHSFDHHVSCNIQGLDRAVV